VQEPFFFAEDNATNPEQTVVEVEAFTEPEQTGEPMKEFINRVEKDSLT
jgi:hypothetical protein